MTGISNSSGETRFEATLIFIATCLSINWSLLAQPFSPIVPELYRESGWEQVAVFNEDMRVFNKRVDDSGIPAIMVRVTATVPAGALASAIEDVGNYTRFLRDVYLERSDLLHRTPEITYGYHLLDLPFISDRHYVYRMSKLTNPSDSGRIRYDWILVSPDSDYGPFIDSMNVRFRSPVYPRENVGGWEILDLPEGGVEVSYRLFVDPAGWVPDFLMARANRVTAPRMVRGMIQEAVRRMNN